MKTIRILYITAALILCSWANAQPMKNVTSMPRDLLAIWSQPHFTTIHAIANKECAFGWTLRKGVCRPFATGNAATNTECADGWTLRNGVCKSLLRSQPHLATAHAAANEGCADGWALRNGVCKPLLPYI